MIPLSCQISDAPSLKYFPVISLCGCIELYDVNVKYHILSILYFEMIFYFIKSIRLSGQWSGAWRCGGRAEIPTHHQSLINTEFQGFVAGAVGGAGGAACSC